MQPVRRTPSGETENREVRQSVFHCCLIIESCGCFIPANVDSDMKYLTRSLLSFVLIYGTKDKARFHHYALSVMERYAIDEKHKSELIEFAYDFFHEMGTRISNVDVISRGVSKGVTEIESKLAAILEKIESLHDRTATGERNEE